MWNWHWKGNSTAKPSVDHKFQFIHFFYYFRREGGDLVEKDWKNPISIFFVSKLGTANFNYWSIVTCLISIVLVSFYLFLSIFKRFFVCIWYDFTYRWRTSNPKVSIELSKSLVEWPFENNDISSIIVSEQYSLYAYSTWSFQCSPTVCFNQKTEANGTSH